MDFLEKELVIPGLKNSYRILHVTDSHVVKTDERDESFIIRDGAHKGKRLSDFGAMRYDHFTRDGVPTEEVFARLCEELCRCPDCADFLVFTGDILDFYTEACFDFVSREIQRIPIPHFFTLGNHDMIFSSRSEEELRGRFSSLCGGDSYLQRATLGELSLIGIDNVHNRYAPQALNGLKASLAEARHALVFQHVPLCTPDYEAALLRENHKNYALGEHGVQGDGSWREFCSVITEEGSPVRALICGDCHFDHEGALGRLRQYTSPLSAYHPPVRFWIHG